MTLVERLRAPQVIEAYGTFEKLHALRHEAADRLEALEEWDRKRAADLMTLGDLVGKLEAALREIAETTKTEIGSSYADCFHHLQRIARRVLEEKP